MISKALFSGSQHFKHRRPMLGKKHGVLRKSAEGCKPESMVLHRFGRTASMTLKT